MWYNVGMKRRDTNTDARRPDGDWYDFTAMMDAMDRERGANWPPVAPTPAETTPQDNDDLKYYDFTDQL